MSFKGKTTIITGANKNLGKETAIEFAKEGSDLTLHYHSASSKDETEKLAQQLMTDYKVEAITFQGDLSDEQSTIDLFDVTISKFGKVDYAINNVGKMMVKKLVDVTLAEYNEMMSINTTAAFLFLREAAKKVSENGTVIMLTTSLLAAYTPNYSMYQASKATVVSMCKALSKETTKKISFNCVSPGPMDTPFFHDSNYDERTLGFLKSASNSGRLTEIHDIVPIIKFLVKDGHWMTGQNLFANNGFLAP